MTNLILRRSAPIRQTGGIGDAFLETVCAECAECDGCGAVDGGEFEVEGGFCGGGCHVAVGEEGIGFGFGVWHGNQRMDVFRGMESDGY